MPTSLSSVSPPLDIDEAEHRALRLHIFSGDDEQALLLHRELVRSHCAQRQPPTQAISVAFTGHDDR